jgi:repressor LexA
MKTLTTVQKNIFDFISDHIQQKGISPTLDEIATQFRYGSINSVRQHLRLIENKGYIKVHRGKSRGIQILKPADVPHLTSTLIPLFGQIAAGPPIFASQDIEEHISVPTGFLGSGTYFALHVSGESMKDVGINHGDIAIIRHQETVQDGEIAAVILENDATLKRFYRQASRIVLRSENPAFQDLIFQQSDCLQIRIAGKLTGLLKRMA